MTEQLQKQNNGCTTNCALGEEMFNYKSKTQHFKRGNTNEHYGFANIFNFTSNQRRTRKKEDFTFLPIKFGGKVFCFVFIIDSHAWQCALRGTPAHDWWKHNLVQSFCKAL